MKRKLFYVLMLAALLSLSACGSSAALSDPESAEAETELSNPQTESLSTEKQSISDEKTELPTEHADTPALSDVDDDLEELENQAEELAESSSKITEGELYDAITAVYPDVIIHEYANNNLSIRINLNHDTVETDSIAFFETVISICESCSLENKSSNISFIMMVDGEFVTMLTMLDYTSFTNFLTTSPVILVDEYKETIENMYSTLFAKNDF